MLLVLLRKYDDLSFICVTLFFLSLFIDQFNCLIKERTCFFSNSNMVVVMTVTSLYYLLTPWSRVLFEKLSGSAASQEIPCIFGTRRFLTAITSARHLSLS